MWTCDAGLEARRVHALSQGGDYRPKPVRFRQHEDVLAVIVSQRCDLEFGRVFRPLLNVYC
jgi:hypothetical protein